MRRRPILPRPGPLILVLALGLPAQDFASEAARARATVAGELEELARWCFKEKLLLERDRTYAALLEVDPEHKAARAALHYVRGKDGGWVRKATYREPKDLNPGLAGEAATRRRAIAARHAEAMLRLVAAQAPPLDGAAREAALAPLVALAPDSEGVRTALGEVKDGDRWVLAETANARPARAKLETLARAAIEEAGEPEASAPSADDERLGVAWRAVFATRHVRGLGTGLPEEVSRAVRLVDAAGRFLAAAFDEPVSLRSGFTVRLLAAFADRDLLLARHPAVGDDDRKRAERLYGLWLGGESDLAQWAPDARTRVDGAVRQAVGTLLIDAFGIAPEPGWAWEGFGLYLGRLVTGTRLTWFVERERYASEDDELRKRLAKDGSDWLAEASSLVERRRHPDLRGLLGRSLNAMSQTDGVFAFAFAAYLLEGQGTEATARVLRRIGEGLRAEEALALVLGRPLESTERRFHRWLAEVR